MDNLNRLNKEKDEKLQHLKTEIEEKKKTVRNDNGSTRQTRGRYDTKCFTNICHVSFIKTSGNYMPIKS